MSCLAIIGDIRDSKSLDNRGMVQEQLQNCLNSLNEHYSDVLISPLTITLGDEFQAILRSAKKMWELVFAIESKMHPTKFRFGFGIGEISTQISTSTAIGMDGPAFYNARDTLEEIKKKNCSYGIKGLDKDAELVNTVLALISDQKQKWSYNRIETLHQLMKNEKVESMAESLGISKAAVYKNINDGSLRNISKVVSLFSEQVEQQLAAKQCP